MEYYIKLWIIITYPTSSQNIKDKAAVISTSSLEILNLLAITPPHPAIAISIKHVIIPPSLMSCIDSIFFSVY